MADFDLESAIESTNIADNLDEQTLIKMGKEVIENFEIDQESRHNWEEQALRWMRLATQVVEKKTFPWTGAANVKFPLLTTASLQFHARAYPSLLPSSKGVVKGEVIGFDPTGEKQEKAIRIGKHMSYQVMHQLVGWEEDMDKMLLVLPIVGCVFKKTYFDPVVEKPVSRTCSALDVVVNYYASCLEDAERVSHIMELSPNAIKERQNAGIYRDVELGDRGPRSFKTPRDKMQDAKGVYDPANDRNQYRVIIEQHCWWDLDDDGYAEPYVVTVDFETQEILRIVARFRAKDIRRREDGKLVSIKPIQYFTKFDFIPNPDNGIYGVGFGILLGPINESTNTLINQLLDAGTLSNLQGGFLAKGIRVKNGNLRFTPGEWKEVNSVGDDLKKGIVPLPSKEPSSVLLNLLQALTEAGQRLSSVSEIFTGEMPGQNTPATTTMAAINEGMKVFSAIYKRIYRALSQEFQKLHNLNALYMDDAEYFSVIGDGGETKPGVAYQQDYQEDDVTVIPTADPNVVNEQSKLMQAQMLMGMIQFIPNKEAVIRRTLEAGEVKNIEELMKPPGPPPPDPEQQKVQMEIQIKQMEAQFKQQEAQMKMEMEQLKLQIKRAEGDMKLQLEREKMALEQQRAQMEADQAQQLAQVQTGIKVQEMEMNHQTFQQQQAQQREAADQQHTLTLRKNATKDANDSKQGTGKPVATRRRNQKTQD